MQCHFLYTTAAECTSPEFCNITEEATLNELRGGAVYSMELSPNTTDQGKGLFSRFCSEQQLAGVVSFFVELACPPLSSRVSLLPDAGFCPRLLGVMDFFNQI
jgi:hypothetical protein